MKNPSVKKLILSVVVLLLVAGVVYVEFVSINRSNLRSVGYAETIAQAQAEHASAADLIDKLDAVGGSNALLRSAVVTRDDLVPFIESLEASARIHRLSPEVTAAQEDSSVPERPIISATLEVLGTRNNVDAFLHDLSGLKYHIAIAGIRLAETEEGMWRATVAVQSYGMPQKNVEEVTTETNESDE